MTPAAKAARLPLLRESWERYQSRRQRADDSPAPVSERSGGAVFCEALSAENLSTYADVGAPDPLAEVLGCAQ